MNLDLHGKVSIVTGAARGIGAAVARTLVDEGARVLLVDRDPSVAETARALGAESCCCDLAAPDAAERVVAAADTIGPCAALVNNAGIRRPGAVDATSDDDWRAVMKVNCDVAFRLTRAFWPRLRETRGAVVNIASFAGKRATQFGGNVSYAVSKHAIVGLTRAAAMDGAADGVRVNAVAPGVAKTEMVRLHDEVTRDRIDGLIPQRRHAEPEEIADAVAFLASVRAGHIAGEVLNVNGGLVMD